MYFRRQDGTSGDDKLHAAATAEDGSVLMAGWTSGNWDGAKGGFYDFVAVKLDADGNVLWNWQVRLEHDLRPPLCLHFTPRKSQQEAPGALYLV